MHYFLPFNRLRLTIHLLYKLQCGFDKTCISMDLPVKAGINVGTYQRIFFHSLCYVFTQCYRHASPFIQLDVRSLAVTSRSRQSEKQPIVDEWWLPHIVIFRVQPESSYFIVICRVLLEPTLK